MQFIVLTHEMQNSKCKVQNFCNYLCDKLKLTIHISQFSVCSRQKVDIMFVHCSVSIPAALAGALTVRV